MKTICELDCCDKCELLGKSCRGCAETNGHPCGGSCVAADAIFSGGMDTYLALKKAIIDEVNTLGIPGLRIEDLALLIGAYVNLAYPLPSGDAVKFLDDSKVYFGMQIERPGNERCYGVVADEKILLVCEYGEGGADPALLLYKKR